MIKKGVCTVYTAGGCDVCNYCTKAVKVQKPHRAAFVSELIPITQLISTILKLTCTVSWYSSYNKV